MNQNLILLITALLMIFTTSCGKKIVEIQSPTLTINDDGDNTDDDPDTPVNLRPCSPPYSIEFGWTANSDGNTDGYKIYVGTSTKNYNNDIDVGKTTNEANPFAVFTSNFELNTPYYFALTAYNTSEESGKTPTEVVAKFTCVNDEIVIVDL